MNELQHRFEGKQANARAIQAFVNRHLQHGLLQRVEVRLSSAANPPTDLAELRRLIALLLSEQGLGKVELSLRPFERALDNASGEHQVRLIFADPASPVSPQPPERSTAWQRWFGRFVEKPQIPPVATPTALPPALPPRRAVELLREAIANAARTEGNAPVARIQVITRRADIDAALQPMMPPQDPLASQALAAMLARAGVPCHPAVRLDYRFEPLTDRDSTQVAIAADLMVRLSSAEPELGDAEATALPPAPTFHQTALPDLAQLSALRSPCLRLRVMGTLDDHFKQPFELRLTRFPARLDRAALEAAGFGRLHGPLLQVASQSCPLLIERHGPTGLTLRPSFRPASSQGTDAPAMYYAHDTRQPLGAETPVDALPMRFIVNSPGGVRDPATGSALPALWVELSWA